MTNQNDGNSSIGKAASSLDGAVSSALLLDMYEGFPQAAKAILSFLNDRIGMGLWMVTRAQRNDWIILHAIDRGYGVCDGQVMQWSDSFCSRMVKGEGPRIAANCQQIPAYAAAPINQKLPLPIGSYIGVPLMGQGGALFGTLCAISPTAQPKQIEQEQPLIELFSRLLSTILLRDLNVADALRQAEQAHAEAMRDSLTGLFNRRGLDELIVREEERCDRYGHDACVVSVDLNGLKRINDEHGHSAGDDMIRRTAHALRRATRHSDLIARTGGDEFLIVAIECGAVAGAELVNRVRGELGQDHISAAIGRARRISGHGIAGAITDADAAMYRDKRIIKRENLRLAREAG